jgi:hypothetical protein
MNPTQPAHHLIPDRFKQPLWIFWLWIVPQVLLLLLNGRAWSLGIGEMSATQKAHATWIGGYELALLLLGIGVALGLRMTRRAVGYFTCVAGLLLHIGYLWQFMTRFADAWPAAVAPWMLPETEMIYYQFALVMPALFYFGVRLACFDVPIGRPADTGISLLALVGIPTAWYLLFQFIRLLLPCYASRLFPETLAVIFFVGSTVLVLMAFLRLLLILYGWLRERSWSQFALPLAAGLLAPLGGLLLNRKIPFPCDFQSAGVYIFTVANGLVLLIPTPRTASRGVLLWLLRSVLFAFSLYFFVVFLPFMPLSLLAMIVCGSGFLILAPTLLFVIHTRQLLTEGAGVAARWGRPLTVLAFVLSLLVSPAAFTGRALADKAALHQAVAVAFTPDYRAGQTGLNRAATRRALHHLREMKDGLYLPFLSDFYNALVFNGMVLPDDKMETLHRVFFGEAAPKPKQTGNWSLFLAPRSASRGWGGRRTPPPRQVDLQDVAVAETVSNDVVTATVTLSLKNTGPANAEYVTDIAIPDGVLVSGYWLDVAGQRKPGRIVEKKTAQWVYHMIRDFTRRDPGLLVFKGENQLHLNIFPFATNEVRTTGIEFLFPRGVHPHLRIGSREVALGGSDETAAEGPFMAALGDGRVNLVLPQEVLRQQPTVTRQPYLHFIVDRSAAATNLTDNLLERLARLEDQAPGVAKNRRITLVNYEWLDMGPDEVPSAKSLPRRGGFCYDRAIAHALLQAQEAGGGMAQGDKPRVPVFVVIAANGAMSPRTVDLTPFQRLVPDMPVYYLATDSGLSEVPFDGSATQTVSHIRHPAPVVLFRSEQRLAASLPDAALAWITFPPVPGSSSLVLKGGTAATPSEGSGAAAPPRTSTPKVFDPSRAAFRPVAGVRSVSDGRYTQGLGLWAAYRETLWSPDTLDERLPQLVTASRASGILTPLTSYMVVENTAQEKILARKEKQALGAQKALEFEEPQRMPEPGAVWLLPVALLLLFLARTGANRGNAAELSETT